MGIASGAKEGTVSILGHGMAKGKACRLDWSTQILPRPFQEEVGHGDRNITARL